MKGLQAKDALQNSPKNVKNRVRFEKAIDFAINRIYNNH
jgi:hypothetical protein